MTRREWLTTGLLGLVGFAVPKQEKIVRNVLRLEPGVTVQGGTFHNVDEIHLAPGSYLTANTFYYPRTKERRWFK